MTVSPYSDQPSGSPYASIPLLALGFRPFYLLACLYAVFNVPLWLAQYHGLLFINSYFDPVTWHAHELIFGFAAAVISGFLLTAVRNWTGQPTPSGATLAALSLLWIAGRILCLTGPAVPAAIVDLLFLPAIGIALGIPLIRTRNSNRFLLLLIGALTLVNLFMHLNQLGFISFTLYPDAVNVAFDLIAILMTIIGGRVIPLFIRNAAAGSNPQQFRAIESAAVGLLLGVLLLDVLSCFVAIPSLLLISLCALAAVVHGVRLSFWAPLKTGAEPLLWILPLSYCWIVLWLMLRAAAELDWVPDVVPHHALSIGAMASLMLGMMTRSALGHTGRALRAGAAETWAFGLIQLAVLLRVLPLLLLPDVYQTGLLLSAGCWTAAFAIILWKYTPMLIRPRIDGKPG